MYISPKLITVEELTMAVRVQLLKLQYSPSMLSLYDSIWNELISYCCDNSIGKFDITVANKFALEKYNRDIGSPCKKSDDGQARTVGRAMQHLLDYQSYGVIFERSGRGGYEWHERFKEPFDGYISAMRGVGYAQSTMKTIESCLYGFETFLLQKNIVKFCDVSRSDIEMFILTFSKYAVTTIPNRMFYLRLLLNFAYQNGYHQDELANVCPKVHYYNTRNSIPSTFTGDEVKRILAAVDRANPCGKRDYAILLTISRLGIRAGDLKGLKFKDIDWQQRLIHIFQSKTKQTVTLPLLDDVGWAIIDYLKNGRPKTDCRNIFVRHIEDHSEIKGNMYAMLQRYLARANISSEYERKHGLHALRHSLASELLANETPLPIISGILGHADSQSTSVYLKVDINQLRTCALEVPV